MEHGRMCLEVINVVARGVGVARRRRICLVCSVLTRGRESDIGRVNITYWIHRYSTNNDYNYFKISHDE